jgi:hypothetical protein
MHENNMFSYPPPVSVIFNLTVDAFVTGNFNQLFTIETVIQFRKQKQQSIHQCGY